MSGDDGGADDGGANESGRIEELAVSLRNRRRVPFEARPIDLERVRVERRRAGDGARRREPEPE